MKARSKLRLLLLQLERSIWREARSCSYTVQLGIEEGLCAHGVKFLTITTPWFSEARKICAGRHFDQVWIEIARHETLDDEWLQWVASLAPIRVGFMVESLEFSPEEQATWSELKIRKQRTESRLKYVTHVVACDEKDAEDINKSGRVSAIWWPQAVPERFICHSSAVPANSHGIFCGSIYGERAKWLEHPDLKGLLTRLPSPESQTIYPFLFDALHAVVRKFLRRRTSHDDALRALGVKAMALLRQPASASAGLFVYMRLLRALRRRCFALWLEQIRTGAAVVNLPSTVKTYQGRVVEGMAASCPVISWEIPNRPRNRALFEDGREILLYPRDNLAHLADHIRHVVSDLDFGQQLATNARHKIRRFHTMERRVEQILAWIETGEEPSYG